MVTDSHAHLWTDEPTRYPEPVGRAPYMFRRRYEPGDFFKEAAASGVTRVVLVQTDAYGDDHRYLADVIATDRAKFAGIARVDSMLNNPATLADRLRELHRQGFRGFRVVAINDDANDHWLDHPSFDTLFETARQLDAAVCPLVDPAGLPALSRFCDRHGDVKVVIDHMARIGLHGIIRQADVAALASLAARPNVYVKLSAFYGLGTGRPPHRELLPLIRSLVDAFGASRLMWGSDCPYQTQNEPYDQALALLRDDADFLTPAERDQLLNDTAGKVFW